MVDGRVVIVLFGWEGEEEKGRVVRCGYEDLCLFFTYTE